MKTLNDVFDLPFSNLEFSLPIPHSTVKPKKEKIVVDLGRDTGYEIKKKLHVTSAEANNIVMQRPIKNFKKLLLRRRVPLRFMDHPHFNDWKKKFIFKNNTVICKFNANHQTVKNRSLEEGSYEFNNTNVVKVRTIKQRAKRTKHCNPKSKFIGVSWCNAHDRWTVVVQSARQNGHGYYGKRIGYFPFSCEVYAARAWDLACKKLQLEKEPNFPSEKMFLKTLNNFERYIPKEFRNQEVCFIVGDGKKIFSVAELYSMVPNGIKLRFSKQPMKKTENNNVEIMKKAKKQNGKKSLKHQHKVKKKVQKKVIKTEKKSRKRVVKTGKKAEKKQKKTTKKTRSKKKCLKKAEKKTRKKRSKK